MTNTPTTPDTALNLDAIVARALRLASQYAMPDETDQDDLDRLTDFDVPQLVAGLRGLRIELEKARAQIVNHQPVLDALAKTRARVAKLQARVDEVERAYTYDTAALKRRNAELEAANKRVKAVSADLGSALAARTEDLMGAETRVAELEKRLNAAAMARVWTNEDGKRFVFADDLKGPLLGVAEPAYQSRVLPPRDARCSCGHTGLDHHHGDTKCWATLPRSRQRNGAWSAVSTCDCSEFEAAPLPPWEETPAQAARADRAYWG